MKIYLASPFFNDIENHFVSVVETILRRRGFGVFSPRENEIRDGFAVGTPEWAKATFIDDVRAIDICDVVVTIYHGNYSDSGTAWECGYAYATKKPVIVVHTSHDHVSNLMVHCSARANLTIDELINYDFENLPNKIYRGKMT